MKKLLIIFVLSLPLWGVGGYAQSLQIGSNFVILPNSATAPVCAVADKGKQYFNSTDNKMYFCNGTAWVESGFALPYSGNAIANAPTHLFKLENGGTGFVAQFNVATATNSNGGLFVSNLGLGNAVLGINSNVSATNSTIKGLTVGTGFAGEFASTNASPKALKTIGGLQLTGISEGAGRVLTSDASGNATWQNPSNPSSTHYLNTNNLDFLPNFTQNTNMNIFIRDDNGTAYFSNVASATEINFMLAPVDLPDGAVVTRLKSFYVDNTSAEQLTIELIRRLKTENTQTNDVMATNLSAATNNVSIRTVQTTTILNSTIDNNLYHYFIKVKIGDFSDVPTQQWRGAALAIRDVEVQYTH